MYKFICDMCGRELEHHGERYIVRTESVPNVRTSGFENLDLCRECVLALRQYVSEKRRTHDRD